MNEKCMPSEIVVVVDVETCVVFGINAASTKANKVSLLAKCQYY